MTLYMATIYFQSDQEQAAVQEQLEELLPVSLVLESIEVTEVD